MNLISRIPSGMWTIR